MKMRDRFDSVGRLVVITIGMLAVCLPTSGCSPGGGDNQTNPSSAGTTYNGSGSTTGSTDFDRYYVSTDFDRYYVRIQFADHDSLLAALFPPEADVLNPYLRNGVALAVKKPSSGNRSRILDIELIYSDGRREVYDTTHPRRVGSEVRLHSTKGLKGVRVQFQVSRDGQISVQERTPFVPEFRDGVNALSIALGSDGVLWTGTSHNGLLGLKRRPDGSVDSIHYPGRGIWKSQDSSYQGPQGNMILSLARQGEGLWMGSFVRALTHFDPGADPWDRTDDRWTHHRPPDTSCESALVCISVELKETITALLPFGDSGLWVGTLNGLFYLDHRGETGTSDPGRWTRIADGAVVSLARGRDNTLWVGFTTETKDVVDEWPQAKAPLLAVRHNGSPSEVNSGQLIWVWPGGVRPGDTSKRASTVLALASSGDYLWVGTSNGLHLLRPVVSADRIDVGDWHRWGSGTLYDSQILSLAIERPNVVWVGAFDVCGSDGGALMRLDHAGTPFDTSDDAWLTYNESDGLKDADVSGIVPLGDNRVAFTTFNLNISLTLGYLNLAPDLEAECRRTNPGLDGLTILDLGQTPGDKSDDVIFDF